MKLRKTTNQTENEAQNNLWLEDKRNKEELCSMGKSYATQPSTNLRKWNKLRKCNEKSLGPFNIVFIHYGALYFREGKVANKADSFGDC